MITQIHNKFEAVRECFSTGCLRANLLRLVKDLPSAARRAPQMLCAPAPLTLLSPEAGGSALPTMESALRIHVHASLHSQPQGDLRCPKAQVYDRQRSPNPPSQTCDALRCFKNDRHVSPKSALGGRTNRRIAPAIGGITSMLFTRDRRVFFEKDKGETRGATRSNASKRASISS
jgi:hypothetical protein